MKYLALTLGWLLRRTKRANTVWWACTVLIFLVICGGLGMLIGAVKAADQAERWQPHTGVITEVGTEPSRPDSDYGLEYTFSQVNLNPAGEPRFETAETHWYVDVGDSIDYWTKDDLPTFDKPKNFWRWIMVEFTVYGLVVGIIILILLKRAEKRIAKYDAECVRKEDEHLRELDAARPAPADLEEFVALCEQNGDIVITWDQARALGLCREGLLLFQQDCFPGRTSLSIRELLPYIQADSIRWSYIMKAVCAALKEHGKLQTDYDWRDHIGHPSKMVTL